MTTGAVMLPAIGLPHPIEWTGIAREIGLTISADSVPRCQPVGICVEGGLSAVHSWVSARDISIAYRLLTVNLIIGYAILK